MLGVQIPLFVDFCNIGVYLIGVKFQRVIVQVGIAPAGIMLQTQQHLTAVFGHQFPHHSQGLRGFQAIFIQLQCAATGLSQTPDTQTCHDNQGNKEEGKSREKLLPERPLGKHPLAAIDNSTMMDPQATRTLFPEHTISIFCSINLLPCRHATNRHVAHHLIVFAYRRGSRKHPVVITVLAAIFHQAGPGTSFF